MIDPRRTKNERRCLKALMEALGIRAYLFTLEEGEGEAEGEADYRLKLEYAICSGWYSGELEVARGDLGCCASDEAARERLLARLRAGLPACPVADG